LIKTISSKIVYKNKWMTVREDEIQRADGQNGIYGVIDKADYALIIPFTGSQVYLVEQYRYTVSGRFWEFPQGSWENKPECDPLTMAKGELREETGLSANTMTYLGHLYVAYGCINQGLHIYLAEDLAQGEQALEPEEQGLIVGKFTLKELNELIFENKQVKDTATLAALALWRKF
jgi:8-oxo-dGTP pyrophosphatase MutT (NUDIX family)